MFEVSGRSVPTVRFADSCSDWATKWTAEDRDPISQRDKTFFVLQNVLLPVGLNQSPVQRTKRPGREVDHFVQSRISR